ncbi:hypothetical protein DL768_006839 [Monosporascus sp. mg162]|nr:hypothetical protein DL768_006839 [Monosporascus sp. mg162]
MRGPEQELNKATNKGSDNSSHVHLGPSIKPRVPGPCSDAPMLLKKDRQDRDGNRDQDEAWGFGDEERLIFQQDEHSADDDADNDTADLEPFPYKSCYDTAPPASCNP